MRRLFTLLLLVSALTGLLGQAFACATLPQPVALAEKTRAAAEELGMEPPSDLFGEAAQTEAQERGCKDCSILDEMSVRGWAVAALIVEERHLLASPLPEAARYIAFERTLPAYLLVQRETDPPRS